MVTNNKISVITPVFNGEKFLEQTIESVLDLSCGFNVELVLVDDGSTDATEKICSKYSRFIKYFKQVNSGESSAVNTGLSLSSGEFILIVNADDPLFTKDIFTGVQSFFLSHPDVVAWYPDWRIINQSGLVMKEILVPEYSDDLMIGSNLCLPGPGTIFRKTSAIHIGGRNPDLKYVSDFDFWLRLRSTGSFKKRDGLLAQWRFHEDSTTSIKNSNGLAERIAVVDYFANCSDDLPKDLLRQSQASVRYFGAIFYNSDPSIPHKRLLFNSIWINRGLVPGASFIHILFLLFTPFSRYLKIFLNKRNLFFLKKFKESQSFGYGLFFS